MSVVPRPCTQPPSMRAFALSCDGTVSRCPASTISGLPRLGARQTTPLPERSTSPVRPVSRFATKSAMVFSSPVTLGMSTSVTSSSAMLSAVALMLQPRGLERRGR